MLVVFYLPMLQYLYMYEQDFVFGPLTFKQFVVILIAVILSFIIYKNLSVKNLEINKKQKYKNFLYHSI